MQMRKNAELYVRDTYIWSSDSIEWWFDDSTALIPASDLRVDMDHDASCEQIQGRGHYQTRHH